MIRNVVVGRLADGVPAASEHLDEALAGIAGLSYPGLVAMRVGRDMGLRAGAWSFAITNDWVDAEAYHEYDADPVHQGYRAMIVEVCAEVARVQFEIDG